MKRDWTFILLCLPVLVIPLGLLGCGHLEVPTEIDDGPPRPPRAAEPVPVWSGVTGGVSLTAYNLPGSGGCDVGLDAVNATDSRVRVSVSLKAVVARHAAAYECGRGSAIEIAPRAYRGVTLGTWENSITGDSPLCQDILKVSAGAVVVEVIR